MCGFICGFGNLIIAHAFVNHCEFKCAGDLLTVSPVFLSENRSRGGGGGIVARRGKGGRHE